jgi:hypothetical protein
MIDPLFGPVLDVLGEIFGGAVFEGVWWLVPKRITRFGIVSWWLATPAALWWALEWWRADPTSEYRTGLACLCWVTLPGVGLLLGLVHGDFVERARLRRAQAGGGVLRNQRLRIR